MLSENPRHLIRELTEKQFDFSIALTLMKAGYHVYRTGWNGKNMWTCIHPGYPEGIPLHAQTAEITKIAEGTVCAFKPYLMMRVSDHATTFAHWTPSNADILESDWMLKLG